MTEPEEIDERLAAAIRKRRPRPNTDFGWRLRERLMALEARSHRPDHLWWFVAAYVCAGAILLLLAALGASGSGPFG
jgi:hypothetical protein